jgi:hypothetical protein
MGTRALTHVFDGDKAVACIYRQCDGYPDGHGKDLADFMLSRLLVNGIDGSSPPDGKVKANGMGCFAAQLIGDLKSKNPVGNIYLYPAGTSDVWEDYVYEVHADRLKVSQTYGDAGVIFDGPPSEYEGWLKKWLERP